MRDRLTPAVVAAVKADHGYDSGWYGNFLEDERLMDADADVDPASRVGEGWVTYPHHPRFGSNYRGLCGRMDLLLEAYSYIPFADRVAVAYGWMIESLRFVAQNADAVRDTVAASRTPPPRVAVRYRLTAFDSPVTILTRTPRTLSGASTEVTLPLVHKFVGTTVVDRPAHYAVSPALGAKLRQHGLAVHEADAAVLAEVPRVEGYGATAGRGILEASRTEDVRVSWYTESRRLPAGWGLVATDQPHGAVAVYLCEPESDDGPIENGLVQPADPGKDLDVWRVR
jgi:hypothetical protein